VTVDVSADVGEGADDLPLFEFVTSVSVACGAHAGDAQTMEACVAEAARRGISVGAHPGYPDREGFGRRAIELSDAELSATLREQIEALGVVCRRHGVPLAHVKPHGALYNEAARDAGLARTIARAVAGAGEGVALVGMAGSAMLDAAKAEGVAAVAEAFADRRYRSDGTLAARSAAGALIEDPAAAAAQALAVALGEPVATIDGGAISIRAETICLHADTPGAIANARAVRAALEGAGVRVAPLAAR
jgi:5-oxoprolinase (ATP-hydrolysing) subunit A